MLRGKRFFILLMIGMCISIVYFPTSNALASCVNQVDQYDVGVMEKYGYSEQSACEFLSIGQDVDTELAREYMLNGFSSDEALAWAKVGFTQEMGMPGDAPTADDALLWKKAGFSPEQAGVLVKSYPSPDVVTELKNFGFTSKEIASWALFASQYRDNPPDDLAKQMLSWKQAGFDSRDAASYAHSGLDVEGGKYAERDCHGRFDQQDITRVNPYRVKNRCYVYNGEVVQLLNETTVLSQEAGYQIAQQLGDALGIGSNNSPNLVRVIFNERFGAPANGADFTALVKGVGVYKYSSLAGEQIVPTVVVLYEIQQQ